MEGIRQEWMEGQLEMEGPMEWKWKDGMESGLTKPNFSVDNNCNIIRDHFDVPTCRQQLDKYATDDL